MIEGKTDHEVLDGSPVVTTFNGKRYVWRQQMRREQRQVRSRLVAITSAISTFQGGTDGQKIAMSIDAVNMILDLAEDYCPEMARDIDDIEQAVCKNGIAGVTSIITDVYQPLFEAWLAPWLRVDSEDAGGKPQDEVTT
jgi:hypothetical protein